MNVLRQRLTIVAFLVASDVAAIFGDAGETASKTAVSAGGKRLVRDSSLPPHWAELSNVPFRKRSHAQAGGDGRHSRRNKVQSDAEEEDDERKLVKIDLSALRSHFPGIAFYNQDPSLLPELRGNAESDITWPRFIHYSPQLGAIVHPQDMEVPYDLVGPSDGDGRMVNPLPLPYVGHPEGNSILLLPSSQPSFGKLRSLALPLPQSASLKEWRAIPALEEYKTSAPFTHPLHEEGEDALYDFLADIPDIDMPVSAELMSLTDNLPLGEEMIVPLDWEENPLFDVGDFSQVKRHTGQKRHVFISQGWKPGGYAAYPTSPPNKNDLSSEMQKTSNDHRKNTPRGYNSLFHSSDWGPGRKRSRSHPETIDSDRRRIDRLAFATLPSFAASMRGGPPENVKKSSIKKNVFFSKGWGPGGRPLAEKMGDGSRKMESPSRKERNVFDNNILRQESQQTWELPRQQWRIPHLFGPYW